MKDIIRLSIALITGIIIFINIKNFDNNNKKHKKKIKKSKNKKKRIKWKDHYGMKLEDIFYI